MLTTTRWQSPLPSPSQAQPTNLQVASMLQATKNNAVIHNTNNFLYILH